VAGTGGQADGVAPGSQTAPSVTTVADSDLVVFGYGNYGGSTTTTLSGFSTNLRVGFGGVDIGDATKTPAGATGTTNPNGTGTEDYAAIHIAFAIGTAGATSIVLPRRHRTMSGLIVR